MQRAAEFEADGYECKGYNEEFYKLTIHASHTEDDKEKISRYVNGIHFFIQDEFGMIRLSFVEESY